MCSGCSLRVPRPVPHIRQYFPVQPRVGRPPPPSGTQDIPRRYALLCIGRIWWKLQSHYFILKMYFLACAYYVVLTTDQFLIKWFFWKNIIFWPKNAFFGKKWLFYLLGSAGQQSCFRTFCLGANFLHSEKKSNWGMMGLKCETNFSTFTPTFLAIFHQI